MKTVAVTGAAGFIGHHLVATLDAAGFEVVALDDFSRGKAENLVRRSCETITVDVTDAKSLNGVFETVDAVLHLAAINGTKNFYENPKRVFEVGTLGTLNVIQECMRANVKTFVFASSAEVYGEPLKVPTNENDKFLTSTLYSPRYSYGSSKLVGEFFVNYLARHAFERTIIFRPHNVYGENMGSDHVIPQIFEKIRNGKTNWRVGGPPLPVAIQGSGDEVRSFAHIDDIVRGILLLLKEGHNGEVYNLGNPEPTRIYDLVHLVATALEVQVEVLPGSLLQDSPRMRIPDITKAQRLGYVPQVDLRSGIQRIVRTLRD